MANFALSASGCHNGYTTTLFLSRRSLYFLLAELNSADIKALTVDEPGLLQAAKPAFENYNEGQLTVVELPGSGKKAIMA